MYLKSFERLRGILKDEVPVLGNPAASNYEDKSFAIWSWNIFNCFHIGSLLSCCQMKDKNFKQLMLPTCKSAA